MYCRFSLLKPPYIEGECGGKSCADNTKVLPLGGQSAILCNDDCHLACSCFQAQCCTWLPESLLRRHIRSESVWRPRHEPESLSLAVSSLARFRGQLSGFPLTLAQGEPDGSFTSLLGCMRHVSYHASCFSHVKFWLARLERGA